MKSDSHLQNDVMAELKCDPSINATQIGIEVDKGIVVLLGHVESYAQKWSVSRLHKRYAV